MIARPFPWEKSYPPGMTWDDDIHTSTLAELIDRAVSEYAHNTALDYRGAEFTYADLGRRISEAATALYGAGVGPGTTLALYLPNTPAFPVAFFGATKTGARLVLLSPLDAERELAHKLADSGARTMVTTDIGALLPMAVKLLDAGALDRVIVIPDATWDGTPGHIALETALLAHPGIVGWDAFLASAPSSASLPRLAPSDIALLQYTGGTTGTPKGAILTHANLTAAAAIYDAWFRCERPSEPGTDRIICVLPLFHIYALTTILLRQLQRGNRILLRPRFDVEAVLRDIEENRATTFPGVPTMWIALVNHPGIENRDLTSLKHCSSGGAPLPMEIATRFENLTGHRLLGGWGMTETAPAGTNIPKAGPPKPGTIGIPMPGIEMGIVAVDDPMRVLAENETGELRIKGPNVTSGYWNRPEETQAAFADGYFLTGDIGHMDEDGYFFVVDRKKDMILSGGFNVYPQVVEQAIHEHPAIAEVLVIGVPDGYRGESAKAFVTLRAGMTAPTLDELQAFLADKVGRHEMPRALEVRDALPRTAVGKYSKRQLKQEELDKRRAQPGAA